MRQTRPLAAALLLAAVFAVPVDAVEPGGAAEETVTGIIEAAQVELGDGRDHFEYTLRAGTTLTPVEFARGNPRGLAGSRVAVTGTRTGGVLRAKDASPGRSLRVRERASTQALGAWETETDATAAQAGGAPTGAVEAVVTAKTIAVVLFNFTDLQTTPFTKAQVQDALVNSPTSTKRFFEEESKGRLSVDGAVYGWYTINATTAGCNWSSWHTLAWNAANAAGANLGSYTNVMFVFPNTSACGWAGLGYVPGSYTYLNGTISVQVMTHELGHNFGLSHSNAANCVSGGSRVMVAAPAECTSVGYADPFSTMGNNALRHNHGSHLGELGWLAPEEKVVAVPGNSYTIAPYFGPDGTKLVRVPRGDGSFFDLDLRTPYGSFDTFAAGSPVTAGVSIRIGVGTASPTTQPKATLLLDSTPGTSDLKDAPLLVGRTMTDPVSTISITAMSTGAAGIVVRVREAIAPTAPALLTADAVSGVVNLAWTAATDNTAVTGYVVKRDGAPLAATGADTTWWTDATAAPGASYTYTVAASDGSENTGPAASVAVTLPSSGDPTPTPQPTAPPDPTPAPDPTQAPAPGPTPPVLGDAQAPTAPDQVSGVPTTTTVALAWTAATDDTGVVGYRVMRNGSLVASPTGLQWKDTARAPRTAYTYTVAALDGVGNVSSETSVTVTTLPDTARPTTPRNFRRIARSGRYVTFDWSPSSDNVRVTRYYVYRAGRTNPVATTRLSKIRIATVRGAYYYVKAADAAGNLSYRSAKVRGRR